MSPQQALDRIAALCDRHDLDGDNRHRDIPTAELRAILAEVSPEPGGVLDLVRARAVLDDEVPVVRQDDLTSERLLDRLAACVRPAAIDRDALVRKIDYWAPDVPSELTGQFADAILALVRPVPEDGDDEWRAM